MPASEPIRRLHWLLWALLIWAGLIMARLVQLQVFQHGSLLAAAERQQQKEVEIPALRGSMFDRTGQPLAKTLKADSVAIDPQKVPDFKQAAYLLSNALELNPAELQRRMESYKARGLRFMWVLRKLTPQQSERVRALNLDWLEFRQEMRRYYPNGQLAAHVLGSVGYNGESDIERGNAGIELTFEKDLGGRPGLARMFNDSRQNPYDSIVTRDPEPGADLTLTIDPVIQYQAERHIEEAVKASGARTGSVVALDPYTGDVLAMANYPTYDPNSAPGSAREAQEARNNLAISTPFEPGSVFKVITMAAALESTNLTPSTLINCGNGSLRLFGRVIHDEKSYGVLPMADVLAKSSNIGTIQVALATGDQKLYEYQRKFGFGRKTGIELPGESGGTLRPVERWMKSSIGSLAMGHELAVTSVQLAVAGAAVANGGVMLKPRLVMSRQRPGQAVERFAPEKGERILRPEVAIQLRQMMEGVVLHGTGKRAVLPGYTSGGKTGSAQIYDPAVRAYTHTYNASFLGFAPVTNPKIVIAVTLHRTTGGTSGYGGVRAAPVFREVAVGAMRMLDVPQDLPSGTLHELGEPVDENDLSIAGLGESPLGQQAVSSVTPPLALAGSSDSDQSQRHFLGEERPGVTVGPRVPDFRGMTKRAVLAASTAAGVEVEVSGDGLARAQDPPPGAVLPPRGAVRIQFDR
jgi:cell division protein FtsI (penicillin-binding protein 3)